MASARAEEYASETKSSCSADTTDSDDKTESRENRAEDVDGSVATSEDHGGADIEEDDDTSTGLGAANPPRDSLQVQHLVML